MLDECFFSFRFKAQNRSGSLAVTQELVLSKWKVVTSGSALGVFGWVIWGKGDVWQAQTGSTVTGKAKSLTEHVEWELNGGEIAGHFIKRGL